jgi:hypothetical protein
VSGLEGGVGLFKTLKKIDNLAFIVVTMSSSLSFFGCFFSTLMLSCMWWAMGWFGLVSIGVLSCSLLIISCLGSVVMSRAVEAFAAYDYSYPLFQNIHLPERGMGLNSTGVEEDQECLRRPRRMVPRTKWRIIQIVVLFRQTEEEARRRLNG